MKYIDLYAGVGGFHQAMKKGGHQCVFSAEINSYAIETYERNYKMRSAFNLDNLIKMSDEEINKHIPNHDIICGGFPCQPFSNAGKKEGFKSLGKGNQFFNILKIIDVKKPKYLFLENVKHIFSHNNGNTYKIIKEELNKRGYNFPEKPIILSPHDFGIPQRRYRVIFVAFKNTTPKNFEFTQKTKYINILENDPENERYVVHENISTTLNAWGELIKKIKFPVNRTLPVLWVDEMRSQPNSLEKLFPKWKQKYLTDMREVYKNNKQLVDNWILKHDVISWPKREKKIEWQAGKDTKEIKDTIIQLRQSGIRIKSTPIFPTLVAMVQIPIIFDNIFKNFRYLSPRETANLQSFPKSFKLNINDYQTYKQMGNAVNVDVIYEVARYYFKDNE